MVCDSPSLAQRQCEKLPRVPVAGSQLVVPRCRIPASASDLQLRPQLPPGWQRSPRLFRQLLLLGYPRLLFQISQSFVTRCLLKTSQRSLESALTTANCNVNSAGCFLPPFPFPFGDELVFQLRWAARITLSLCASSQGGHSARTLCTAGHPSCPCLPLLSQKAISHGGSASHASALYRLQ